MTGAAQRRHESLAPDTGCPSGGIGRRRLPNAYLYDEEIIPRVSTAILADGRFADASIWVEGQRRWVFLKGCVRSPEQAMAIEQVVRHIDDVEAVINELAVVKP